MQTSAANIDDKKRLINKLLSALSELLSMKKVHNILHICETLGKRSSASFIYRTTWTDRLIRTCSLYRFGDKILRQMLWRACGSWSDRQVANTDPVGKQKHPWSRSCKTCTLNFETPGSLPANGRWVNRHERIHPDNILGTTQVFIYLKNLFFKIEI